jgi:hypothetical protein
MPKPKKSHAFKPTQLLRLSDEAAQAVADYQKQMLDEQNIMISINKSINALIVGGWQSINKDQIDNQELQ